MGEGGGGGGTFCMRLTWLEEGSTSPGQLNGKRPDSSTYSDTPHDQMSALCPLYLPCSAAAPLRQPPGLPPVRPTFTALMAHAAGLTGILA